MARIAGSTEVLVVDNLSMLGIHIDLVVLVAIRTGECCIRSRVHVAVNTSSHHMGSCSDRKIERVVIPGGRCPAGGRVARLTGIGESCRKMVRRGSGVIR